MFHGATFRSLVDVLSIFIFSSPDCELIDVYFVVYFSEVTAYVTLLAGIAL